MILGGDRGKQSVDDILAQVLHPGQDIVISQAWGAPHTLLDALARHRERMVGSRLLVGMLVGGLPVLPGAEIEAFFPSGPLGSVEGLRRHSARYVRRSLFELARDLRSGNRPVDVLLTQLSRPRDGRRSLGVTVDFAGAAAERARVVVGETGDGVPWTGPGSTVEPDRVVVVDTDAIPLTLSRRASTRDSAIAEHIAHWIPHGATLQLGMASWVDPLVDVLQTRRGIRIHSGLVSDWARTLADAGAIDPSSPIIATGAAGTAAFYEWLESAERVQLRSADSTHAPDVLSTLPLLRAVNSALEVDLAGNVNSEIGHGGRRGGVAGLHDFAGAASAQDDGLSIIALPATSRTESRVVARLPDDSMSLPPRSADVVITEFGAADLRGLDRADRIKAMLTIAAPEHRSSLARSVES